MSSTVATNSFGRSVARFRAAEPEMLNVAVTQMEVQMSPEFPRPACPSCGSNKVGTLAKEITDATAWRCASCGETFKAPASRRDVMRSKPQLDSR